MMKATKPIGLDDYFREVFPGDEVQDADGRSFTITPVGWAKPLGGGSEVAFKRLKKPVLVRQASKFAEGPDGKVGPVSRLIAAPGIQAAVKAKESKPSRVGIGGKKNKSGWSKLNAICRTLGVSGQGLTGYLRDHGFEVFRAEGTSCVKVEDREKVVAFLRDNPPPAGLPKTSSYDGVARRIKANYGYIDCAKAPDVHMHDGIVEINFDRALKVEREICSKHDNHHPGTTPDTCTVREAGDQMLVDELRARGWTVTCTKTQSL